VGGFKSEMKHPFMLTSRMNQGLSSVADRLNRRDAFVMTLNMVMLGIVHAQESQGTFGFVAKVDADGLFNPTLKTVLIQSVQRDLPAALAGITAGDTVVEVDGVQVAGSKASAMADRMKKKPGEAVTLRLVRADGQPYVVRLVAVPTKS
jgi:C-terminal processing protease CtpA/Prc